MDEVPPCNCCPGDPPHSGELHIITTAKKQMTIKKPHHKPDQWEGFSEAQKVTEFSFLLALQQP